MRILPKYFARSCAGGGHSPGRQRHRDHPRVPNSQHVHCRRLGDRGAQCALFCFAAALVFRREAHSNQGGDEQTGYQSFIARYLFPQNKVFFTNRVVVDFSENTKVWKASKPDYLAAFSLIMGYFVLVFNISLLEK